MSGDIDRYRIDVACEHPLAEQLCRSDRQDPRSGTDIERAAKPVPRRQALERHQTSAGRRMLAGPERGCRVDHDSDGSGWNHSAIMRAIYKESSDPHRGESELIFCQPVPGRQLLFRHFDKTAPSRSCTKGEPRR